MIQPNTSKLGTNTTIVESASGRLYRAIYGNIYRTLLNLGAHAEETNKVAYYWFMQLGYVGRLCFVGYCWIEVHKLTRDLDRRTPLSYPPQREFGGSDLYELLWKQSTASDTAETHECMPHYHCAE